jgi:iron complex outermembrane receptor protein
MYPRLKTLIVMTATTGFAALFVPCAVAASTLDGTVVDSAGRALAQAMIEVTGPGVDIRQRVTEDGGFEITLGDDVVAPLTLTASAPGFRKITVEIADLGRAVELRLAATPLFAAEVRVTTNRAIAGETPVTVTNIGREEIERRHWGQDVPMFLDQVPSFYATNDNGNGIGYSYFFLRGFDMRRTAVSLNGVPLNDAHSHSVFFIDLADFLATTGDIQVQRGVGTNLYGGSAIGGSVDLRTATPETEPRLRLDTTHGAWGTHRWSLQYDSGLVNGEWAATFRYSRVDSDGYRDQSWVEAWNYFGTVEHYGDRTTTRLVLFGGPERTHLAYEGIPKRYLDGDVTGDARHDRRHNPLTYAGEVDEFVQPHFQLAHDWRVSDDLTVSNTLYYFEGDGFYEQFKTDRWLPEYNLEPFPGPGGDLVETTDLIRRRQVDEWDAGWIPSIRWRHADGRGSLEAGVATRVHRGRHWGETVWAQSYPPDTPPNRRYYDYRLDKTTVQPFVQETFHPNERWTLLAGLTWVRHEYDMSHDQRRGVELTERYTYALPRLGVTFQPADGWSLYGNLSRGGREPAFRDIYDPQDYYFGEPIDLEPEKLTDLELGMRRDWAEGWLNANLYWLDFDNAIVFAGGLDNNGAPVTANGAVVTQWGAELEAAWMPVPRWGARLALSYTDATFDEFVEFGWDGVPVDQSGNRLAAVPEWLASLELSGGIGPIDLMLAIRHVGSFYLDNTEDLRRYPELRTEPGYIHRVNDAFTRFDAAAEVSLGPAVAGVIGARDLRLRLRVDNLTDELYTTFGYMDVEPVWIPAATRSVYVGIIADW